MHNLLLFFREEKQHMTIEDLVTIMDDAMEVYDSIIKPIGNRLGGGVCLSSKWGITTYYTDNQQIDQLADLLNTSPTMLDFKAGAEHNGFIWYNSADGLFPTQRLPKSREIEKLEDGLNQIAGHNANILVCAFSDCIVISVQLPKEEIINLISQKFRYSVDANNQISVDYKGKEFHFTEEDKNFARVFAE